MLIKPKKLQLGDVIGIISPCYYTKEETLAPRIERLKKKGFEVKLSQNLYKNTYGYAASPQERAEDFNAMIADKEVKMILFGGGEVGNEILPLIDYSMIAKNPKILVSYSDGTSILNAVTYCSKVETFYGQAVCTFGNLSDYNWQCFESAFMHSEIPRYLSNSVWQVLSEGECEGELLGGYLVNFSVMLGRDYLHFDKNKKYILFIEDHVNFSEPSVISKYFSHLEQSGLFKNVTGLLFGHYAEEPYPIINEVLQRLGQKYSIPIVRCEDFGHGENNAIIPIGIKAKLNTQNKSLIFEENLVIE